MSVKNFCLLCLEHIEDCINAIDLNTPEAHHQQAKQLLEKYFNELFTRSLSTFYLLCAPCWSSISTFHAFCERVQRAHLEAINLLDCLEPETKVVKEELELIEIEPPPIKSRRGRPRKIASNAPESPFIPVLRPCTVLLKRLEMPSVTPKQEAAPPSDTLIDVVKHEALLEQCLDFDFNSFESPALDQLSFASPLKQFSDINEREISGMTLNEITEDEDKDKGMKQRENPKKKNALLGTSSKRKRNTATKTSAKSESKKVKEETEKPTKNISERWKKTLDADDFIAENFKLSCCLCNAPLSDFKTLKEHFRTEHNERGYVRCCGKKLLKRGVLVDHLHFHQDPNYFKCPTCARPMADRRSLELHLQNHDHNQKRIYQCPQCCRSFAKITALERHMPIHIPKEEQTHVCPRCEKRFPDEHNLKSHIKLVHLTSCANICEICGKSIKSPSALRIHMEKHSGTTAVQCKLCGSTLTNKYGLARHMLTMHTEEYQKPHTCEVCGKVTPSKQAHKQHMKFMHRLKRNHVCTLCNKGFKLAHYLKEHMTTHTGESLYTCAYCPKKFNSIANIYKHRKKSHPIEWANNLARKKAASQNVVCGTENNELTLTPVSSELMMTEICPD